MRHPVGLTTWLVASLAIGMTVVITAFAFLVALLIGPFPRVVQQWRLLRISMSENCGRPDCWRQMASPDEFAALQSLTGLNGVSAYTFGQVTAVAPEIASMPAAFVSPTYFDVLGVRAVIGRVFSTSDEAGRVPVAMLSHRTWTRVFGSDPGAIGRTIRVADTFVQIVGVTPEFFVGIDLKSARGDNGPALWLPLWLTDRILPIASDTRGTPIHDLSFVGRLRDGVGVAQVQSQANVLARQLRLHRGNPEGARAHVRRVWRTDPENWGLAVMLLMPIPLLVLAIACINAANLMLTRALGRGREVAVRLAIGSGRTRIVRQLLLESTILATLATMAAAPFAQWALRVFDTPLGVPVRVNGLVLALVVLTVLGTTVTFGLMPALRASAQDPWRALAAGTRGETRPRQWRARRAILTAQVALSIGLLATGWQLVSTVSAQPGNAGATGDRLLIARFDLQRIAAKPGEAQRIYNTLLDEVSRMPGVEAVGLAGHTSVWRFGGRARGGSLRVWLPGAGREEGRVRSGGYVGGSLFAAIGAKTIAGRSFTSSDRLARPDVAVVNQTFAQQFSGAAIGSIVRVAPRDGDFASSREVRIVGVVESPAERRILQDAPPPARIFLPSPIESEPTLALYIRTRDTAATLTVPLQKLVSGVAPRVPIQELGSLDELTERSDAPQLWLARAAVLLGTIGILLAGAGVYAVSSFIVGLRAREFAIRMAVGAAPRTILQLVFRESLRIAYMGVVFGGLMAFVVGRVIEAEYHGVRGVDAAAFGAAAALFVTIMILASAIPAVRASRVDPVRMLAEA